MCGCFFVLFLGGTRSTWQRSILTTFAILHEAEQTHTVIRLGGLVIGMASE